MSLTILRDLEQGTDEWLDARRGLLTASTIGALISPKTLRPSDSETARSLILRLAAERISGRVEDVHTTRAMERGTLDEPLARAEYEKRTGSSVEQVGLMVLEDDGIRLGYSPDGLVGDDGLIEIKSRAPKSQVAAFIDNRVPAANLAQLHAGLFVSGRDWIDYVSYCGGMPLYIKRVTPDPRWREAIEINARRAETQIAGLVERYRQAAKDLPLTEFVDHFAEPELTWT